MTIRIFTMNVGAGVGVAVGVAEGWKNAYLLRFPSDLPVYAGERSA